MRLAERAASCGRRLAARVLLAVLLPATRLGPSPGGYNAYLNEVVGRVVRSVTPG